MRSILLQLIFSVDALESDKKDLLSELEVMKTVKPHQHVIKLLGCVTDSGKLLTAPRIASFVWLRNSDKFYFDTVLTYQGPLKWFRLLPDIRSTNEFVQKLDEDRVQTVSGDHPTSLRRKEKYMEIG